MKVTGIGSILCFHFTKTPVDDIKSPADTSDDNKALGDMLHIFLLERGYYIARRGFVALSLPLGQQDLSGFVEAVRDFLQCYESLVVPDSPRPRL